MLEKYRELAALAGDHAIEDWDTALKDHWAYAQQQQKRIIAEQKAKQRVAEEEEARYIAREREEAQKEIARERQEEEERERTRRNLSMAEIEAKTDVKFCLTHPYDANFPEKVLGEPIGRDVYYFSSKVKAKNDLGGEHTHDWSAIVVGGHRTVYIRIDSEVVQLKKDLLPDLDNLAKHHKFEDISLGLAFMTDRMHIATYLAIYNLHHPTLYDGKPLSYWEAQAKSDSTASREAAAKALGTLGAQPSLLS